MNLSALPLRNAALTAIRTFLNEKKYVEADVPTLVPSLIPESYLDAFETTLKAPADKKFTAYLAASPEAYLKRLLTENKSNVFYLGKAYRNNEPLGHTHNHEFTILEWYLVGATYIELMKEIEVMLQTIYNALKDKDITLAHIDLSSPFEYITVIEAYKKYAHVNPSELSPEEFEKQYVQHIEPNLGRSGRPTFLIDFPLWQSPLALENVFDVSSELHTLAPADKQEHEPCTNSTYKASARVRRAKNEWKTAQRFELYINGVELINGWTELTDWKKQQENFDKEQTTRKEMGKNFHPVDTGFIKALQKGMPECAGAAMGVDRLLMVLGDYKRLEDVILFPDSQLFS